MKDPRLAAALLESSPDALAERSYGGALKAGQSVTLLVQVSRGSGAGSAAISFQGNGSDTQVVPVTWHPGSEPDLVRPGPLSVRAALS
jgi:hypothetical protein